MKPLQLAAKYAGFAAVEAQILGGLNMLDCVRESVRDTSYHFETRNESEEVLEALSCVKRYLEEHRDKSRSEMSILRGQLAGLGDE